MCYIQIKVYLTAHNCNFPLIFQWRSSTILHTHTQTRTLTNMHERVRNGQQQSANGITVLIFHLNLIMRWRCPAAGAAPTHIHTAAHTHTHTSSHTRAHMHRILSIFRHFGARLSINWFTKLNFTIQLTTFSSQTLQQQQIVPVLCLLCVYAWVCALIKNNESSVKNFNKLFL